MASLGTPNFLTGSGSLDIPGEDGIWGPNVFLGAPVFTQGIPEPSTWAMMILGFAGVGFMAYRRSRKDQGLALAA